MRSCCRGPETGPLRREAGRRKNSWSGPPVILFARHASWAFARSLRGYLTINLRRLRSRKKFAIRFGLEAMKFVNSRRGKELCLRGINAKVVESGRVSTEDTIRRV